MKPTIILLAFTSLLTACGQGGNNKTTSVTNNTATPPHMTITPVNNAMEFPLATLAIKSAKANMKGKDSSEITFDFDVENYVLQNQTDDTSSTICSNSAKGQHIHFIMDNQPYVALYEPTHTVTLANNTEHYLLAFLSRSYHASLKHKGAAVLYHFKIDGHGKLVKLDDPKTPMVFYSRPKGEYIGKDTANLLLDFYVWNAPLSKDSFKVQARITNEDIPSSDTTITITDWKPYFIHDLGMGKSMIKLTLLDKDDKTITGPETSVSREFHLYKGEPIQ